MSSSSFQATREMDESSKEGAMDNLAETSPCVPLSSSESSTTTTTTQNPTRSNKLEDLGVSVHWLATGFLGEVRAAGLEEGSAKIYDLECLEGPPGVIRSKGANVLCPVDTQLGASYVHCLLQESQQANDSGDEHVVVSNDRVGPAEFMLSYSWGYTLADIVNTLLAFCQGENRDPKRTYIWMCCLCVNQHRVVSQKESGGSGLLNFEQEFPLQLARIGHMLAMMAPWSEPLYLQRVWCIFELYTAHEQNVNVTVIMPPEQKCALEMDLFGSSTTCSSDGGEVDDDENRGSNLKELYAALLKTRVQNAGATLEADRDLILGMIAKNTPGGYGAFNNRVNELLRSWIRGVIKEIVDARFTTSHTGDKEEEEKEADVMTKTTLMSNITSFLLDNGEPNEALRLAKHCISIREATFGTNHPSTAESYANHALILSHKSQYDAAFVEYRKALVIQESLLESNHLDLAVTYNNIGVALSHKGDYDGALKEYEKALAIRESVLGAEHTETAATYNNIGNVLTHKGDHKGALVEFQKSLKIRQSLLGEIHPRTAATHNNIGNTLSRLRDFDGALQEHRKALAIREVLLGPDHPGTAASYGGIGAVLERQKKYDEAMKEYQKGLAIFESVYGTMHASVAACYRSMGVVLEKSKNYDAALIEYQKSIRILEAVFASRNHPKIASACTSMGFLMEKQGKYDAALEQHRRALAIRIAVFGEKHHETAKSRKLVACILRKQGNLDGALIELEKAHGIYESLWGKTHRETAECFSKIGSVRKLQAKLKEQA